MKDKLLQSKYIMALVFCFQALVVLAQQPPQYTQYMYNTMNLNPGYTGSAGNLAASVLHRSQWMGMEGAPETQSFALHGRVKDKLGLGVTGMNDNLGAAHTVQVNANVSYHLPINRYSQLALGLNAGFDHMAIDWSKGIAANTMDAVFQENFNEIRPIIGAGLYYYTENWYLGLSSNNFLNSKIYKDNEGIVADRKSQYYVMAGYVFDVSEKVLFKPSLLTKHVSGAPLTVDVSANVLLQEKVSLGLAYRYNDALSALAGIYLSSKFFLGYAYDYSITGMQNYNDGSHEIILTYNTGRKRKRALSPRFF